MQLLTQEQIRRGLRRAGATKPVAKVLSACAMCEAPGPEVNGEPTCNADLVGDQALANDTWGYSYGPLQVRSLRADKGTGRTRDEERLLNFPFHWRSAVTIEQSQGLIAWSTYRDGQFKAYLQTDYPPPDNHIYVKAGDTLSDLALTYDTTWEELARINGLHSPYTIYIGQILQLP